jgi:hypothetical protein
MASTSSALTRLALAMLSHAQTLEHDVIELRVGLGGHLAQVFHPAHASCPCTGAGTRKDLTTLAHGFRWRAGAEDLVPARRVQWRQLLLAPSLNTSRRAEARFIATRTAFDLRGAATPAGIHGHVLHTIHLR